MPGSDAPDRPPPPNLGGVVSIVLPARIVEAGQLCESLRARLAERAARVVVCDASARRACDMRTIDLVARLALIARQGGARLVLRDPSPQLRSLLTFAGLAAVIPCAEDAPPCAEDSVEPQR